MGSLLLAWGEPGDRLPGGTFPMEKGCVPGGAESPGSREEAVSIGWFQEIWDSREIRIAVWVW